MAQALSTTVAGLKALSLPSADDIYQTTDYGGGQWRFDPLGDPGDEDTGTILANINGGTFNRILDYGATLNIVWFGAKDVKTDDADISATIETTAPINTDIFTTLDGKSIFIPEGYFFVDSEPNLSYANGPGVVIDKNTRRRYVFNNSEGKNRYTKILGSHFNSGPGTVGSTVNSNSNITNFADRQNRIPSGHLWFHYIFITMAALP